MDAVEFVKEYFRMCATVERCDCCPAYDNGHCSFTPKNAEKVVFSVEKWSKEHPQKTMIQDFFEKFPNAPKTMLGFPYPCAKDLGYPKLDTCSFGLKGTPGVMCSECWSRPMED